MLTILDRYKNIPCLQRLTWGTGIVTLAGILSGLNISGESSSTRYISAGAGTAGCGCADRVLQEFVDQEWIAKRLKRFYLVDRQGLLFDDMDNLTPQQEAICSQAF